MWDNNLIVDFPDWFCDRMVARFACILVTASTALYSLLALGMVLVACMAVCDQVKKRRKEQITVNV